MIKCHKTGKETSIGACYDCEHSRGFVGDTPMCNFEQKDTVIIYLHESYSRSEIEEVYGVTGTQAEELYDLLYEVPLEYNFKTKKLRVV